MRTILIFLSLIILLTSCEDVIEIELNHIEPKLVIEGVINDLDNQCTIKLSKTTDYFNQETNSTVSDAVITLTDNAGTIVNFIETEPGIYMEESVQPRPNINYTLNIVSEGDRYVAKATIPQKVNIVRTNKTSYSLGISGTGRYNEEAKLFEVEIIFDETEIGGPKDLRRKYRFRP